MWTKTEFSNFLQKIEEMLESSLGFHNRMNDLMEVHLKRELER